VVSGLLPVKLIMNKDGIIELLNLVATNINRDILIAHQYPNINNNILFNIINKLNLPINGDIHYAIGFKSFDDLYEKWFIISFNDYIFGSTLLCIM